jgi:hypothetical protein
VVFEVGILVDPIQRDAAQERLVDQRAGDFKIPLRFADHDDSVAHGVATACFFNCFTQPSPVWLQNSPGVIDSLHFGYVG